MDYRGGPGFSPVARGRMTSSKVFWKEMAYSFLIFWGLDLATSAILVRSGFNSLEGNVSVRSFFVAPTPQTFVTFADNQAIYLLPLLMLLVPVFLDRLVRNRSHEQFYAISGLLALLFALYRLNFGVASNTANLIAIAQGLPTPASAGIYYMLWILFDGGWAVITGSFLWRTRKKVIGSSIAKSYGLV